MPVKGLKEVRQQLRRVFGDIKGPKAEKTLTEVLITAAGFAATMTPIDTSNLINSQYRKITAYGTRVVGAIGYTAAYAAAVHDKPGTLLGKNVPRDKNDPSRGNVWDKGGEPEFLRKAFEDSDARAAIDAVIKRGMTI
jgi:preprotein translocase subunit Sss1